MKQRRAFSLIEIMIVLAVAAVITVVAGLSLTSSRSGKDLKNAAVEMGVLLREAQSRSVAQANGAGWGVHFDNTDPSAPFFALFSGTSYSTGSHVGNSYPLPPNIIFDSATLASGASFDITFAQITGLPSTSTVITLDLAGGPTGSGGATTTVTVNRSSSGQIFFDNFNRTNL